MHIRSLEETINGYTVLRDLNPHTTPRTYTEPRATIAYIAPYQKKYSRLQSKFDTLEVGSSSYFGIGSSCLTLLRNRSSQTTPDSKVTTPTPSVEVSHFGVGSIYFGIGSSYYSDTSDRE
jgi:hypothetical protein